MGLKILQSDCVQIGQMISSITTRNASLSEKEQSSIFERLDKRIASFSKHLPTCATPHSEKWVRHLLGDLNAHLLSCPQNYAIQEIRKRILTLETTISNTFQTQGCQSPKLKIELKIGFFCDIDASDDNLTVARDLLLSILQNQPFITTRSLLGCKGASQPQTMTSQALLLEIALLNKESEWEVFQQKDPVLGQEMLVFLPKSLLSEKQGVEKLAGLDFVSDGTLQPIPMAKAFTPPAARPSLEAFLSLFTSQPKIDKLFYLSGHGASSDYFIASLTKTNYVKFLEFLKMQRCQALIVDTCYAGGQNSLIHFQQELDEKNILKFGDAIQNPPFPILIRSIGDFCITTRLAAEENLHLYYQQLACFLENNSAKTLRNLREHITLAEAGDTKIHRNSLQAYLPHSPGIHGGFRALGERSKSFSLSHNLIKQKELEVCLNKRKENKTTPYIGCISVNKKEFLEIYPLVIGLEVHFIENDPVMLSMVPGRCHHFIYSLTLCQSSLNAFIKKTIQFHNWGSIEISKAFFIGNIKDLSSSYQEVVLWIKHEFGFYAYRQEDRYYLSNGNTVKEISTFQHAVFLREAMKNSQPQLAALQASSGGQETFDSFLKAIESKNFWVIRTDSFRYYAFSMDLLASEQRLESILGALSTRDKEILVVYLLSHGFVSQALTIIQNEPINPNCTSLVGTPIIFLAIQINYLDLVEYLIQKEVDVNISDPSNNGNFPLHQAIIQRKQQIASSLLKHPKIDVNVKNSEDLTPIWYAAGVLPEIYQKLKTKGASHDILDKNQLTPLGLAVQNKFETKVTVFLEDAADPNKGNPSPLQIAVQNDDVKLVEKLIEKGGKPFSTNEQGNVPFVEAILKQATKVLDLLLIQPDCNFEGEQKGINPAVAILMKGTRTQIEAFAQKKAPFPKQCTFEVKEILLGLFDKYLAEGRKKQEIEFILKWNGSRSAEIEHMVAQHCLEPKIDDLEFLEELIEADLVKPNSTSCADSTVFFAIFKRALLEFERFKKLLDLCKTKGANCNMVDFIYCTTPLKKSLQDKNISMTHWLLSNGARSPSLADLKSWSELIKFGDLSLIQLAYNQRRDLEGPATLQFLLELECAASALRIIPEHKILNWLVEQGADFNAPSSTKATTPFAILAGLADLHTIAWAIDNGALVVPPNPHNKITPLEAALSRSDDPERKIFKLLKEHPLGADPSCVCEII